jgi:hypothetical protein
MADIRLAELPGKTVETYGMSGIAYVLTKKKQFENGLCNMEMVALNIRDQKTSYI